MTRLRSGSLLLVMLVLLARQAWGQEVGTIAGLEGTAEIVHAGAPLAAAIGSPVYTGDELRTGHPGKLRVVFQDDSVLTLSDDSHVVVDEQVFDPNRGAAKSLINLLRGKLSATVGEYYNRPGNSYQVKTPTALAGVRGTEFEMAYDPDDDVTEVVGVSGHVEVHSLADPTGPGVLVTASEVTTVPRGQLPTPPRRLDERIFRQRLEGINFIGGGRPESLTVGHTLATGASVPERDRAPAVTHAGYRDASSLLGDSPQIIKAMTGQLGIEFPR